MLSRRDWLQALSSVGVGISASGWLHALANEVASKDSGKSQKRACVVLWMGGGPSQTDTFDLKTGHENGGPFKEIETSAAGVRISEHLPQLAKWGHRLALVRSMTTKEGDHARGTQFLHSGYLPQGPIQFPPIGSLIAKELGDENSSLPNCFSIAPARNVERVLTGGFLGPNYAPLAIGGGERGTAIDPARQLRIADLMPSSTVSTDQLDARLLMRQRLDESFANEVGSNNSTHPSAGLSNAQQSAYDKAVKLMRTEAAAAFDLDKEPQAVRDAYGRTLFGQGCLLARRLIERGVPFVEVNLSNVDDNNNSWDTHQQNFERLQRLSAVLDPGWATLMRDLEERGLLETTTIVWMGEFGRTPKINNNVGRDHYPAAWSTVLAGGGIKGGQVIGKTSDDGMRVVDRPVSAPDLIATVCSAIGIDPKKQNLSNVGRPIRIADPSAKVITEALA